MAKNRPQASAASQSVANGSGTQLANREKRTPAKAGKAKKQVRAKRAGMHTLAAGYPLSWNQYTFIKEYMEHGDAQVAYIKGYLGGDVKDLSIKHLQIRSQNVFRSRNVVNTIAALTRESMPDTDTNSLISLLYMAINGAASKDDFSTMGANVERIAKLAGLIVDRKEIDVRNQMVSVNIDLSAPATIEHDGADGEPATLTPRES